MPWGGEPLEPWRRAGDVHPVQTQHVEVDVQVERAAEALDQGDGAGAGSGLRVPGLVDEVRGQCPVNDAKNLAHHGRAGGQQETQRERHREHPLAHRHPRQDVVHQQGSALGHAPGPATGAEPPAFATERHQAFVMAGIAAHAQKAVFQPPTLEVVLELARILMRHILEHNYEWEKILKNAILSFSRRMCLVIFTPFRDKTHVIKIDKPHEKVPLISFKKGDLTKHFVGIDWVLAENLSTATQFGIEHIFFLEKREREG